MDLFLLIKKIKLVFIIFFLVSCISNQTDFTEQPEIFDDNYMFVYSIELDWPYTQVQNIYLLNETVLVNARAKKPFSFFDRWNAYDVQTGQKLWSARSGLINSNLDIVYDEKKLYTDYWRLKAIDLKTGEIVWDDAINAASNISISEKLLFVGDKYKILIYDKELGELVATDDNIGFRPRTFYDPHRNWFVAVSNENISIYDGNLGTLIQNMNNTRDEKGLPICASRQLVAYWDGKIYCGNKYVKFDNKFLQKKDYIGRWVSDVYDNRVFLLREGDLVAYDLLEEKILWQKTFFDSDIDGEIISIRSEVVLVPPYGTVFTSDSRLHVFRLEDGEEISSTLQFPNINFEDVAIEYSSDLVAANEEFVIITLEDSKFSIYEKIEPVK